MLIGLLWDKLQNIKPLSAQARSGVDRYHLPCPHRHLSSRVCQRQQTVPIYGRGVQYRRMPGEWHSRWLVSNVSMGEADVLDDGHDHCRQCHTHPHQPAGLIPAPLNRFFRLRQAASFPDCVVACRLLHCRVSACAGAESAPCTPRRADPGLPRSSRCCTDHRKN